MEIVVRKYDKKTDFDEWDHFIFEEACNATFLQSRKFLSYHPDNRFIDCSIMFYMKGRLVAVCPGCMQYEGEDKLFASHSGSTYGGLIFSEIVLRAEKMLAIIDAFEQWLRDEGYKKCVLKQNNPLMNAHKSDLLDFCLYYRGFKEYRELDLCVDYLNYNTDDILANFSKLKKRMIRKCRDKEVCVRELFLRDEIDRFLEILKCNLQKYNKIPYHSVEDLLGLKLRFPNEIQYWGAIYEGKIVAVSMVFLFPKVSCAHTHYLAADFMYNDFSPMTYIYYQMIEIYKNRGYRFLSWGITSEHLGVDLNLNLTNTKEEFGSSHNIVSIYEKVFQ